MPGWGLGSIRRCTSVTGPGSSTWYGVGMRKRAVATRATVERLRVDTRSQVLPSSAVRKRQEADQTASRWRGNVAMEFR